MLVFSSGKMAAALLSPLEYSQPALFTATAHPHVTKIVVLTGWAADDRLMPLSGRLNASSAYRILMAMELYRDCPRCDIIISGAEVTTRIMAEVVAKLGVPDSQIIREDKSGSTAESAANLQALLGTEPFFLVTSAGHMPRSLGVLNKQGLVAIPAPTEQQQPKNWRHALLQPSPQSLYGSDLAAHEYIGIAWYRLTDRMSTRAD
jgi:uncharacterized SAM-binding protein YcdF (DUF218 family)